MTDNPPHFFPMSKVPDLVWQLQRRSIDYTFVIRMKNANRFLAAKHRGRYWVHSDSLEDYLGLERGEIKRRYQKDATRES